MKKLAKLALCLFATLIAGCASLPNAMTTQVDQRRVEYALIKNGGPAIIFENGLGGTSNVQRGDFNSSKEGTERS